MTSQFSPTERRTELVCRHGDQPIAAHLFPKGANLAACARCARIYRAGFTIMVRVCGTGRFASANRGW